MISRPFFHNDVRDTEYLVNRVYFSDSTGMRTSILTLKGLDLMLRFSLMWPLLVGVFLAGCAPTTPETAPASNAPVSVAAQVQRPADATCATTAAINGGATSKGRHVPNEDDPCADSRGAVAH